MPRCGDDSLVAPEAFYLRKQRRNRYTSQLRDKQCKNRHRGRCKGESKHIQYEHKRNVRRAQRGHEKLCKGQEQIEPFSSNPKSSKKCRAMMVGYRTVDYHRYSVRNTSYNYLAQSLYGTNRREQKDIAKRKAQYNSKVYKPCLLYTSPSPRDRG